MKFKEFIKENYKFIILMILIVLFFNVKLPYYIMAPGGTINITDRVVMDNYNKKSKGSLNMLYVSEYEGTPASLLLAKLKSYDIESNKERQISNESVKEINRRNTIMRDNSLDIATMVAYTEAGKSITIKEKKNVVIARTKDNGLEVGDIILSADNTTCEDVNDIKKIINNKEENDTVTFKILRNNKEKEVNSKIYLESNSKVVGVVIVTEYDYDIDPKIDIKFKNSESGASGGLMLTLTIYNAITDEDIIKDRKIAGTGTISYDGTVGEIDGIKYKIMGAAKDNVKIVFVPTANYEEAIMTKNKYKYDLEIVRFWLLSVHYRKPINFSDEVMEQTKNGLERLYNGKRALEKILKTAKGELKEDEKGKIAKVDEIVKDFELAMDDDLNTADGISSIYELIKFANTNINENSSKEFAEYAYKKLMELANVIGILFKEEKKETLDEQVEKLIEARQLARKNKDFQKADEIRDELKAMGITLKDTRDGVEWSIDK